MPAAIDSIAFQRASLDSERYRMLGILCLIAGFIVMDGVRMIADHNWADTVRLGYYMIFWLSCAACEWPVYLLIGRARRAAEQGGSAPGISSWIWIANTVLECSFPTIALLALTLTRVAYGPYLALISPPALVYTFFIILSTLRLRPSLSILSGAVSAAGYVFVYLVTIYLAPHNANREVLPSQTYMLYPVFLFAAGVIAAAVARQIRLHVIAALQEAETRLKLDRIEHDLNVARTIQMGLLPKSAPVVPGYDIAGFSRPADQTGGDYYDWLSLPEGKVLFVIADAAGHGIGPALLIAACRAYFRALANHNDPLDRITAQVDKLIAADIPANRFITAAVALLDPAQNRLSLYSAGHAPLYFYVAATGLLEAFDADQPPLGVSFPSDGSTARVLELSPGDSLILVTDGFFECANAGGELLGMDRLGDAIRLHQNLRSEELIQKLVDGVMAFTGSAPQADDITALIIKRSPLMAGILTGPSVAAP